jgi:hypothetical protein
VLQSSWRASTDFQRRTREVTHCRSAPSGLGGWLY